VRPALLHRVLPLLQAGLVVLLARVPAARDLLPVLGLFSGPLGWLLLAGALLMTIRRLLATRLPGRRTPALPTVPGWLLFVLTAAAASAFGLHYSRAVDPSGDEIDYLMMAQSVWREGDLDLRDNFARGDFREYMGGLAKMPGGVRDKWGRHHPTHSGGFAVVLAPAYAVGGRSGCVVWIALLTALLGLLVRGLALRVTGDSGAALVAWLASVGPPVLYYDAFLYSEPVVALCIAIALHEILWPRRNLDAALAALALAALPWLHVRMAFTAVALGGFALVQLRGRQRWVFAAIASAMAVAYTLHQLWSFGALSPFARYGGAVPAPIENATPLRTLVGLWVDGAYGLLPYAPVFLLVPLGLAILASALIGRRPQSPTAVQNRAVAWALVCTTVGVLLPVLGWRNWWGFSPPARFTIPFVPVFAVAIAIRLAAYPGRGLARWRAALLAAGFAFAVFLFAAPRSMLMINGREGTSRGFDALAGTVSFSRYLPFPSSRLGSASPPWGPPPAEARVAAVWVAALLALFVLDALALKRDRLDRWFAGLTLPLALLIVISLTVDTWARRPTTTDVPPRRAGLGTDGLPGLHGMLAPALCRRAPSARSCADPAQSAALGSQGPCSLPGRSRPPHRPSRPTATT
jgi:hypothetical protein